MKSRLQMVIQGSVLKRCGGRKNWHIPQKKFNFHSDLIKKGYACWGMHGSEWHEGPIIFFFFCYLLYSLTPDKSVLITAGNESFISDCGL